MTVYCDLAMTFTMEEMSSIVFLNKIKPAVLPVLNTDEDKSSNLCFLFL